MNTGLGNRIKARRLELGLSQEALANRMGLKSKSTICKIERGDDNLTTTAVSKYAEALETTPSHLMGWDRKYIISEGLNEKLSKYPPEEVEKALQIIDLYENASPEGRAAFETLLKLSQQKS